MSRIDAASHDHAIASVAARLDGNGRLILVIIVSVFLSRRAPNDPNPFQPSIAWSEALLCCGMEGVSTL